MNGPSRTLIGIVALTLLAPQGVAQEAKAVRLPSSPEATRDIACYGYRLGSIVVEDSPRRTSALSAGGSFLLVKPYFSSNTAYSTRTGITTPSPQQTATDFVWQFEPAMAFWVG